MLKDASTRRFLDISTKFLNLEISFEEYFRFFITVLKYCGDGVELY